MNNMTTEEHSLLGYNIMQLRFSYASAASNPEDGSDMFLRNIGPSLNYTELQPRISFSS
jgi:hypothetical protein